MEEIQKEIQLEFYARVRKTGNSYVVTIPKFLVKKYGIGHFDIVKVIIKK